MAERGSDGTRRQPGPPRQGRGGGRRFPFRALGVGTLGAAAAGGAVWLATGSALVGLLAGWLLGPAFVLAVAALLAPREGKGRRRDP